MRGQRSGFFQVVPLEKVSFSFFVTVENYFCFLSFQLELWLETFTSSQVASVVAIKIYFWGLWDVSIFKLKGYSELEIKMTPHPPLQACIHILSGQYSFLPAPLPPDSCLPWDTHWISRICEEIGVSLGFSESIKTFCLFCEIVCFSCLVLCVFILMYWECLRSLLSLSRVWLQRSVSVLCLCFLFIFFLLFWDIICVSCVLSVSCFGVSGF